MNEIDLLKNEEPKDDEKNANDKEPEIVVDGKPEEEVISEVKNPGDTEDNKPKNGKMSLDVAMYHYKRLEAKEQRKKDLEEKEKKKAEELRRMRKERRETERALAEAEKELAVIRKYAGLTRETSNIRKRFAVKGFFDLLSSLDCQGERDITDAYNFIGDTEWLGTVLASVTMVSADRSKIVIDGAQLRKAIFAKKDELDTAIAEAKKVLDGEWQRRHKDTANKAINTVATESTADKDVKKADAEEKATGNNKGASGYKRKYPQGSYKPAEA